MPQTTYDSIITIRNRVLEAANRLEASHDNSYRGPNYEATNRQELRDQLLVDIARLVARQPR